MRTIIFFIACLGVLPIKAQSESDMFQIILAGVNTTEVRSAINIHPVFICYADSYEGSVTIIGNLPWVYPSAEGEVDGIGQMIANDAPLLPEDAAYYNLQGQRIVQPQSGQMVIIRYSNGTSRKMLVR